MELLGGDADLGPQTELASIGEGGGRVPVHRCRVHSVQKRRGRLLVLCHDGLGVHGPVGVHVVDGLQDAANRANRQLRTKVLGRPVLFGGNDEVLVLFQTLPSGDFGRSLVKMEQHASLRHVGEDLGQEVLGYAAVCQQGFRRVAHAIAAALGIQDDCAGHGQVGRGMHVHMAVAGAGLDHGNLGMLDAVTDQAGASPGNEHVHHAMELHELVGGSPVGAGDDSQPALGHSRLLGSGGKDPRHGFVGAGGHAAASQNRGVSGLQADSGGIGGDVGARLVDHGHHAQGYADAPQLHAVVHGPLLLDLTQGIGKVAQLLQGCGHGLDAPPV